MNVWEWIRSVLEYPLFSMGGTHITLLTLIDIVVVILFAFGISALSQWFLRKRIFHLTRFDSGFQYMICRIVGYAFFVLAFLIGLQTLGIDLTSFTVLAGAVGVGIGFGLQNIVNNFISGIILLSERTIQIGDRIHVGDVTGFIQEIGARSSLILTSENTFVSVPNSEFISKPVKRWGRDENNPLRIELEVAVAYNSDLKLIQDVLVQIASENPYVVNDPPPFAGVYSFSDSSIIFKLSFSTILMMHKDFALRSQIFLAIDEEFQKRGIIMPFPHYQLVLKDPVKIELNRT